MVIRLRVDCYEAGTGSIGGLAAFHNSLYPRLQNNGFEVKTFSMRFWDHLPQREDFMGVIVRRPLVDVDLDTAYAWTYDIMHQYGIDVGYLTPAEIGAVPRYFTNFAAVPTPYRMSEADLFLPNDWMSYPRSALFAWLHPELVQAVFLHSTEPGRAGGIWHQNYQGTSGRTDLNEFSMRVHGDFEQSFFAGLRLIRDLEFPLTYRVLRRQRQSALFTVSKIHRKEYLLGLRAHGVKFGDVQNRVFSIYHGVDTKFYRPLSNVQKEGFRVGFIGRCSPVKGIDMIPPLASLLEKRIPGVRFHIVTKSEPQNPYYLDLIQQIHDARLDHVVQIDNTFYTGEQKIQVINSWDIFLCPSRYEPQGQIDLEAMACGVIPAVGMGGLREKTVDGFNSVWVDPEDVPGAAEKIDRLYRGEYQGRKTEEIRQNCRDTALKVWDWDRRAKAHEELYTYLCDGRVDGIRQDLEDLLLPTLDMRK